MGEWGSHRKVCTLVGGVSVCVPRRGSGCLGDGRKKEGSAQSRHDKQDGGTCMPGDNQCLSKSQPLLGSDPLTSTSAGPRLVPSELALCPR